MIGRSSRHEAVAAELAEWWEDVSDGGIGSRVVLVEVPEGWAVSAAVDDFRERISGADGPVQILVSVDDVPAVSQAVAAGALRDALRSPFAAQSAAGRVMELLSLDSVAGEVQLGLGLGSLFASGMAAAAGLLLGSLAVTAAGNAWDASAAGQQGGLARAARGLAAVSVAAPVAVVIAEAGRLDFDSAVIMIENLVARPDGRVLVVAVTEPDSALAKALSAGDRYELAGRVRTAEADPAMDYSDRADLARELCPWLPAAAIDRIAHRTRRFAEVFAVAKADRLADLTGDSDPATVTGVVDLVIETCRVPEEIPRLAVVLDWAGGALTAGQADRALQAAGFPPGPDEAWVSRAGTLVRLRDPASARVADQVAALGSQTRRELAAAVLARAADIARDGQATLVERTVARLAAHRVRGDLADRNGLAAVQYLLIRGLEQLGDLPAAREVARAALAELPAAERDTKPARDLQTAALRVTAAQPRSDDDDPVIRDAVAQAQAASPLFGPEARVWAAVHLLNRPGPHEAAMTLAGQVAAELARLPGQDVTANQWRALLAFHVGRAGNATLSQQILSPAIASGTFGQQEAAQAVLRAINDPHADTRLQIIMLEAELAATPATATAQLLHLHRTLATDYGSLGDYQDARRHSITWHELSTELHGADHPDTLNARYNVAAWTGDCGDARRALCLSRELLTDQIRVLGANHPDVLATRGNIAAWTGDCGDARRALRLSRELLPEQVRVLGANHRLVLRNRNNIAYWTRQCGRPAEGLRLARELLPDQVRVLGAEHPDVLDNRNNIAAWTGYCGDARRALRLFRELLTDRARVMGAEHPKVLTTRNNIAYWTGHSGEDAKALRLFQELLPDKIRVLGANHPGVLDTRNNIAYWTRRCGRPAEALQLYQKLLPDQIRVLGAEHPDVRAARNNIASLGG